MRLPAARFGLVGMVFTAAWLAVFAGQAAAELAMHGFDMTFTGPEGASVIQAGAHPFEMITTLDVNTVAVPGGEIAVGDVKQVKVELPAGLAGSQVAVPRCTQEEFSDIDLSTSLPACSNATAVGVASITAGYGARLTGEKQRDHAPIYNLEPPPGVAAEMGFVILHVPVTMDVTVNPNPPYNLIATLHNIPQAVIFYGSEIRVWGVPADPRHDALRGSCVEAGLHASEEPISLGECPSTASRVPLLTMPRSCMGPMLSSFEADSWEEPEVFVSGTAESHDSSTPPVPLGMTGCDRLGFLPTIGATPTDEAAESPSGLDFTLNVEDEGLNAPNGVAQSDIKKVVVTLPESMSVNPALAEGLTACDEASLARETAFSAPGEGCPKASKIGTVEVETPLLARTLKGALFLATPYANPFGSLIGLYVVIKDPETGILLRLAGKVVPNETTGQLVSVFDNLPQLPFSHFRLHFREGERSPLATPPACGTYTTEAALTPWADPATVLHDTATFNVSSGIAGGSCPPAGAPPFKPGLTAGTVNNAAGADTSMDIRITRNDGEQEITGFSTVLPPGLIASLTGVPFCSEADIAAAEAASGAAELAEPSCPAASEIGVTQVGVGVGSVLAYTPGRLYMAGPYQGAPFSVVSITSATVGPFDLGTVVVHLPLQIDPRTAQVSIPQGAADQIPHIVKGIVVHVRDIRVEVNRPDFMQNPTSCNPMSIEATVFGSGASFASAADDQPSRASERFQAADCQALAFEPSFKASTSAKTSRKDGASLRVTLEPPAQGPQSSSSASGGTSASVEPEEANIHSVHVELPKALPSRLTTLKHACVASVFDQNPAACPPESRVGLAKAVTPVLPVPLEGPAYFVSHGGEKFPELIVVLQGYGVTVDLQGETFISKAGITSSTFRAVPDVPVDRFELTLPEGKYSALAANRNLCGAPLVMPTVFTGQNGAQFKQNTPIEVEGCSNALSVRGHHIKKRTLTLKVYVPSAGKLHVGGRGVSSQTKRPRRMNIVTVKVHERRAGRLKTRIEAVFTPSVGKARKRQVKRLSVQFKAPERGGKHHGKRH